MSGTVDRLREYKVAFRGLAEGKHQFTFVLDEKFFDCFPATQGTRGEINAEVWIVKSALLMEVRMKIEGSVKATCDRCLGEMEVPVTGEMNLYVKQGIREAGNDDDFIVLAPDDDFLDLSSYLYEVYMLHFPMKVIHPEGECDEDMQKVLNQYMVKEGEQPTDPRWEDLKKLINN